MFPVREADDPLAPYRDTDNLARSRALDDFREIRMPSRDPGLTVVILTLDRADLMLPLLDHLEEVAVLLAERDLGFEVIVGDTGSRDPSLLARYDRSPPWLSVVRDLTYQFSACNNACVDGRARFDTLLFLNNDVLLTGPEPVLAMFDRFRTGGGGILGAVLDFPDDTIQHAGIDILREGPLAGLPHHPGVGLPAEHQPGAVHPAVAVTGACLMISSQLFGDLGGFDEAYEGEAQDVDLCLAAHRAGEPVRVLDIGPLVHLENATRTTGEEHWQDRRLLMRRWESYLRGLLW